MLERDCEEDIFPYCIEKNIGVVPFSPVASGFLSGKVTTQTSFEHIDDVRKFVPQLSAENMEANQPVLDLLGEYAEKKNATKAQISMAWMLKKYPNVVPIPGSKNQERILENLGASEVKLTDAEFAALQEELDKIPVSGHRGNVEFDGGTMKDWGKKK
jgi:aryl-alcohol dehydrogenase-like predicted oxidoreductase